MTLMALAGDLPALWNDATASIETRKRILRAVLKEIIVTVETGLLHLVLHWQGGDHTRLEVLKNRSGQNRYKTDVAPEQLVRELARLLPDRSISIAPVLNRSGIRSARGQTWTQLRVRNFRGAHSIPVYREGERAERRELILREAASRLGVSYMTVVRLIRDGPGGSAWFPHLDGHGAVAHIDVRGPTYKGSLIGGAKSLFRVPPKGPPLPRLVSPRPRSTR